MHGVVAEVLDPGKDTWLHDHCPTYVLPALPMMSVVERLCAAAEAHADFVARLLPPNP